MRRMANTGKVYCPYCSKGDTRMGNLKAHITGFVWGKCNQIQADKTGPEIWSEIIERNPRQD